MTRRLVAVFVLALALAGCDTPTSGEDLSGRGSHLDTMEINLTLLEDSSIRGHVTATFADDEGGLLPIPVPRYGSVTDVEVDGRPVSPGSASTADVPVTSKRVEATFIVHGAVDHSDDITIVQLPMVAAPSDNNRGDPPVAVSGGFHLEPPVAADDIDFHWIRGLDRRIDDYYGNVNFHGRSPIWLTSEILVGLPPDIVGEDPLDDRPPFFDRTRATFERLVRDEEAASTELEATLKSQEDDHGAPGWVGYTFWTGLLVLWLGWTIWTAIADRRDRDAVEAKYSGRLAEPPDRLEPAIVQLLAENGRRLDGSAVAGTLLDLADRGVIDLSEVSSDQVLIRVPADATGAIGTEHVVLDALRAESADGEVLGPPLWHGAPPAWWANYRSQVFAGARAAGLIRRRIGAGRIATLALCLTGMSWPIWGALGSWAYGVVLASVYAICVVLNRRGGHELTLKGFRAICRWRAFGRYAEEQGAWEDVGAAGIVIWGPYLAYGTVLGICPFAASQLRPDLAGADRDQPPVVV